MPIRVNITPEIRGKVFNYAGKHFPSGTDEHYGVGFDGGDQRDIKGIFGELIVVKWLGRSVDEHLAKRPLYSGDGGIDIYIAERGYDIKSKLRKVKQIYGYYECSVSVEQHDSSPAYGYIFCSVYRDYTFGHIMGFKLKHEYKQQARYCYEGDMDESNNFVFPCDAYNLRYDQLEDITALIEPAAEQIPLF